MKRTIIVVSILSVALIGVIGILLTKQRPVPAPVVSDGPAPVVVDDGSSAPPVADVAVPLDRARERVTKKPFGIYITPRTSPVQPERFTGYHTGTDYETFPEEADTDVTVRAVCPGTLSVKRHASGYGGVVVERCVIGGNDATVVYGHLVLSSVTAGVGATLAKGDAIGFLGKAGSSDTDGERKHLHLGIHKGPAIDILGYVQSKSQLSAWLDACDYFCK